MLPKNVLIANSKKHIHFVGHSPKAPGRWAHNAMGSLTCDLAVVRILRGKNRGRMALITWGLNLPVTAAESQPGTQFVAFAYPFGLSQDFVEFSGEAHLEQVLELAV